MRLGRSPAFRIALVLALVASIGWGAWVYNEAKPHQLVHSSAYTYYRANVASQQVARLTRAPNDAAGYVRWAKLTPEQQAILKPLEKKWDFLSSYQRRSLLETARRYPKMTAEQQKRYQSRLVEWTRLTRKERTAVRKTYKQLAALPTEKQQELEKTWLAEHEPDEDGDVTPTSAEEE